MMTMIAVETAATGCRIEMSSQSRLTTRRLHVTTMLIVMIMQRAFQIVQTVSMKMAVQVAALLLLLLLLLEQVALPSTPAPHLAWQSATVSLVG